MVSSVSRSRRPRSTAQKSSPVPRIVPVARLCASGGSGPVFATGTAPHTAHPEAPTHHPDVDGPAGIHRQDARALPSLDREAGGLALVGNLKGDLGGGGERGGDDVAPGGPG